MQQRTSSPIRRALVFDVMACIAVALGTMCSSGSGGGTPPQRAGAPKDLVGRWSKIGSIPCAAAYPAELEFREATYLGGRGASGQGFLVWDAGGYQMLGGDRVKIDTASDAQVIYQYGLVGDVLTFVDDAGCTFRYRRAT